MYLGWAGKLDKILRGEDILAHWTYTPEYWAEYTKKSTKKNNPRKKGFSL